MGAPACSFHNAQVQAAAWGQCVCWRTARTECVAVAHPALLAKHANMVLMDNSPLAVYMTP